MNIGNWKEERDNLPEEVLPRDAQRIYHAQKCYREAVSACATIMRLDGFDLLAKDDLWLIAHAIEDALSSQVRMAIDNLEAEGFDPDVHDLRVKGGNNEAFLNGLYREMKGLPKEAA
jgi:hypothetical protein